MKLTPSDIKIQKINEQNGEVTLSILQWCKLWHYIGELQGRADTTEEFGKAKERGASK